MRTTMLEMKMMTMTTKATMMMMSTSYRKQVERIPHNKRFETETETRYI